jgi:hypothetical protein
MDYLSMIALRDFEIAIAILRRARDLILGYQSKLYLIPQTLRARSTPATGPGRPYLGLLLSALLFNSLAPVIKPKWRI